jgi:DNA-binding NtrC family response regulator
VVKVLFVDDDPGAHKVLAHVLPPAYTLLPARTGQEGLEAVAREDPDVVLLDIGLPDMDGMEVLRAILARPSAPPVVMLTAQSGVRMVKEAIQAGANDYIVKPYAVEALRGTLAAAVRAREACDPVTAAVVQLPTPGEPGLEEMLGEAGAMGEVRRLIRRYGPACSPVLVLGETGTGKELAARALHGASPRRAGPLVAVNCAALPESLLETELFGCERGAFTDATSRPGSFERADGGTLFLDEVGELSAGAQARLLRALEAKEITRVGGTRSVPVDVRIVSATHRDLKVDARDGRFRDDLYWRLSVLPIRMPALRERPSDICLLALHFLARCGRPGARLSPDAREKLASHPWPGNVRELRNVMERAALAAPGQGVRACDILFD